jgi:sirohydrochlorin cobaltochelatase
MNEPAIILFAHGARDPDWAAPFNTIRRQLQSARPQTLVQLAFQDFMTPTLDQAAAQAVAGGARRVLLVPLFMAQGGHLKQDLPRLVAEIRGQHPQLEVRVMPAIGDAPEVLRAIGDWVLRGADA